MDGKNNRNNGKYYCTLCDKYLHANSKQRARQLNNLNIKLKPNHNNDKNDNPNKDSGIIKIIQGRNKKLENIIFNFKKEIEEIIAFGIQRSSSKNFYQNKNLPSNFKILILGDWDDSEDLLFQMLVIDSFLVYNKLSIYDKSAANRFDYKIIFYGFKNKLSKKDIRNISKKYASHVLYTNQIEDTIIEWSESHKKEKEEINEIIEVNLYSDLNKIIPPEELDTTKKYLLIFKDYKSRNRIIFYY